MACMYCDRPEYGHGVFVPLCQKHMQLRAITNVLERQGKPVTARAVRNFIALASDPVAIEPGEVETLLRQMEVTDQDTH